MDTSFTESIIVQSENANLLISEATYLHKHLEKSEAHNHLTSLQAAQLANSANVKKLIMTHFSQRYPDTTELEEEARNIFENSFTAYDFMKIKL